MPFFQAIATQANQKLTSNNLQGVDPTTFAEPGSLVSGLQALDILPADGPQVEYIEDFPSGLKEAVRAVLHDNLNAPGGPLGVTVAWTPGYDDEVSIFQVADNARSAGGITLLVKSRYPNDRTGQGTAING